MRRALPALAAGLALAAVSMPAHAAPTSSAQYLHSTPPQSSISRYCHPEDLGQCDLGNDLIRRLDRVKRGGRIDVVLYSTTRDDIASSLVRAASRGVKVRLLTSHPKPDGETSDDVADEVQSLVDRLRAKGASVKVGWGSLSRSGKAGLEHRKLVLIDPDGKLNGNEQTISDSGNWTYSLDTAYNDRMVVIDRCMYDRTRRHLDALWKDKSAKRIGALATCDGRRKLWMMPESHTDPVLTWAKKAKCGKGDRVTFANFYLTGSKGALVDRLIAFRKAGAAVQVAANDDLTGHYSVTQKRRMVKAGIDVRDVSFKLGSSGRKVYNHEKALAAVGCSGGSFAAQGSTTMNSTAYTKNGNAVLTSTVTADAQAMQAGFASMVKSKRRLTAKDL